MGLRREPSIFARLEKLSVAKYLSGMSARTLAYKLMVATPVIFFAGLGVESRTYVDPYVPIEESSAEQAAITAYVDVMRATKPILRTRSDRVDPADLRRVADLWIQGSAKGELKPLYPVALDDTPTDGAKGQIFNAKSHLVTRLLTVAKAEAAKGNFDRAIEDADRAISVSQTLKFSCFESVHTSASEQKKALDLLLAIAPKLDDGQATWLRARLLALQQDQKPLNGIATVARRQYIEECIRQGEEPLSIEEGHQFVSVRKMIEQHPDAKEFRRLYQNSMLASNDPAAPALLTVARLSCSSQSEFAAALDAVIKATKKPLKA
jgi:hypothetical protein